LFGALKKLKTENFCLYCLIPFPTVFWLVEIASCCGLPQSLGCALYLVYGFGFLFDFKRPMRYLVQGG